MTDLEMTKLCAEAMGLVISPLQVTCKHPSAVLVEDGPVYEEYSPLHDDAHAMALVKKFDLILYRVPNGWDVWPYISGGGRAPGKFAENLNRAIVECVAKMQDAKP